MSVFPLWYAPAVPPELGGAQSKFGGTLKNFFAPEFVPQLQNRVGAYGLEAEPPAGPGAPDQGVKRPEAESILVVVHE